MDDILIVSEASQDQVLEIKRVLDSFCTFSGQKVNLHKSTIFFSKNVPSHLSSSISNSLGIPSTTDIGK